MSQPPEISCRDKAILRDLGRVRLLSGSQLERLHFANIATVQARGSARRRSLGRLVNAGLVTTLPRRVGGERAGSAGLIYALDSRALKLRWQWDEDVSATSSRIRRPWPIGWRFVLHTLDVAELYVRIRERDRDGSLQLLRFDAEPASWYGQLKPDAYAVFEFGAWERHLWIEVDRATESLPTLRRKLAAYVQAAVGQDAGPAGVLPEVLVTVPTVQRARGTQAVVDDLGGVAPALITVQLFAPSFAARPPP